MENESFELPAFGKAEAGRLCYPMDPTQALLYQRLKKIGKNYATTIDIKFYLPLEASIDAGRLEKAVREVIHAHSIYAAELVEQGDEVMVKRSDRSAKVERLTATDAEAESFIATFGNTPRQPDEALHRFVVLEAPSHIYLFGRICHAVTDMFSCILFIQEIAKRYNGGPVESESRDWFDWVAYKEACRDSEAGRKVLSEVGDRLADFPLLPTNEPVNPVEHYAAPLLGKKEMKAVQTFAIRLKTNKMMLLMAAFSLAMMRMQRQDKVALAMTYHGRSIHAASGIHGSMACKMPMLAELPASGRVTDYVAKFLAFRAEMDQYAALNEPIMAAYADRIDYMVSFNVHVPIPRILFEGNEVEIGRYPVPPFSVRLMAIMTNTPEGWFLSLQSNRWSGAELQALHESLRQILLRMPQCALVAEL